MSNIDKAKTQLQEGFSKPIQKGDASKKLKVAQSVSKDFSQYIERADMKYGYLGIVIDELDADFRSDPSKEQDQQIMKLYGMWEELNSHMSEIHSGAHDLMVALKRTRV